MAFKFRDMIQTEAEEIAFNWHYDGQYSFYDMEADEEDLAEFLDPTERKGAVFAAYEEDDLVGFISIAHLDESTIEIGLGLRPDLTGQGLGGSFIKAGLAFAKAHFSFVRVTLAVAAFNVRAIRLYEKIGFRKTEAFKQETNGSEYKFVQMEYWLLPSSVEDIMRTLVNEVKTVLYGNFIGLYIHGSLATGGFNPTHSDIDVLVIVEDPLKNAIKQQLRNIFLRRSREPFPIEISVMNRKQLTNWQHPSLFEFHYSEMWRHRTDQPAVDPDLAAHLTVLRHRGFCVLGEPVADVIPEIPWPDYMAAIFGDFDDCRATSRKDPVNSVLNAIRVLMAVRECIISSKEEAIDWGMSKLPENWHKLIHWAADNYANGKVETMNSQEVDKFLRYMESEIKQEVGKEHAEENYRSGLL